MLSQLPKIDISDKIVIIGYSGSGKTYLLDYIMNTQLNNIAPIYVIDTVNRFSKVPSYNYSGITECINKRKNKTCIKIHTELQLEKFISYLNHKKEQFFLCIDEIDRYTNTNNLLTETKLYLEEGRNFNRGGIFTIRRVGFLNKSILGNSHYLFLFKLLIKTDIEYLSYITGINLFELEFHNEHSFYVIDLHLSQILGEYIV